MRATIAVNPNGELNELRTGTGVVRVAGYGVGYDWVDLDTKEVDAVVDTGAHNSCLPSRFCQDSNGRQILKVVDGGRPFDWQGKRSEDSVPIYYLRIALLGLGPFDVYAYQTGGRDLIIGRDLLRRLFLALDGPCQVFGIRGSNAVERILRRMALAP